jgi:hypothetical protein
MARRKNVKRIDPRYFLHETVNRNDDGSVMQKIEQTRLAEAPRPGGKWASKPPQNPAKGYNPHLDPYGSGVDKHGRERSADSPDHTPPDVNRGWRTPDSGGKWEDKPPQNPAKGYNPHLDPGGGGVDKHGRERSADSPDYRPPQRRDGKQLQEAEGETPQDVAARISNIPGSMKFGAIDDLHNMKDGSDEMVSYYPHVQDLVAFATEVLELLGEI